MSISLQTTAVLRELAASEPVSLTVNGSCMRPTLADGDRIRVRSTRCYLPGDLLAFRRSDGRLLVHRLLGYTIGRRGLRILASGDRLSREDEPVALTQVVGRVIAIGHHRTSVQWVARLRAVLDYLRVTLRRSVRSWVSATSS